MGNIEVGRYTPETGTILPDGSIKQNWKGWIQDEEKTWIAFIDMDGVPHFFLDRCKDCGGILTEQHPDTMPGFCYHRDPETGAMLKGCHQDS